MELFKNIKHSISKKLLIRVFSIYFAITLIVTFIHMYEEYQYTKESVYNEVVLLEDTFKVPLSNAIWDYNIEQRNILLQNLQGISVVSGVQLFSKENLLLKEYGEVDDTKGEVYSFPLSNIFSGSENWLGYVKLYSKEDVIIDRIKVGFIFIVVNSIIKTLLLWFLFLWVFDKLLSRPLNELSEEVAKIDLEHLENNYNIRRFVVPDKPNEFELFKGRFAEMLNKMLVSKKQLDSLNETLDEKVQIKTKELQNSLDDFKTLLDSTIEGMVIFDEDRRCIELNEPYFKILGYNNKEELIGKHLLDFVHEDSLDEVKRRIQLKETALYEVKLIRKNNEIFPALARGMNTQIQGKEVRITAIVDLSELKKKENMLLQHTKHAAMGEMIGNIAHQWRQPLSVISTAASGLELQNEMSRVSDEEILKTCTIINDKTQYLSKTIDGFRNYLQDNNEKYGFNLYKNINNFLEFTEGTKIEHGIMIDTKIDENVKVLGYPSELIQCYISLFNNSRDAFLHKGIGKNERYIFITEHQENKKVIIEFKDNAGGIPEDIINKIFDPYFTTKHKSQGTGLGLHMLYNLIVNGMGGNIKVSNVEYEYQQKLYRGVAFSMELPLG